MANIMEFNSNMPALCRFSKTVVMPKAQRPNGAGLAMPSFTGRGVVGIMSILGLQYRLYGQSNVNTVNYQVFLQNP